MAILDSVRKLAEKVGADTNGRDIADQLNIINRHLDNTQPGSRDIAEAVSKFADKEDGTARLGTRLITENDTYTALNDELDGYSSVTVNVPSAPTPETFEVEITITDQGVITSDKTYNEVMTAINTKSLNFTINGPEGYDFNPSGYVVSDGFIIVHMTSNTNLYYFLWANPEYYEEFGGIMMCEKPRPVA